ncbi:ribonuclease H-like domain-containing protein, partial [Tanacetum coccineum]
SDEEDDDEVAISGDDDDDADNKDDDDGQDDDNQDDDNKHTDSDNDGDDFVHPNFSTHDEEDIQEEGSDLRVNTPSHYESTDDEESDEEIQGVDVEEEEMDEENTNEEEEVDELYRDVNVNLEGRDTEMNDAPHTFLQTTQVIEDTHVIITLVNLKGQQQSSSVSSGFISNMLNPSPDSGIDSIFNLNTESTSLVDVLVTTIVEIPLLSATTHPIPPIPLIPHPQKTPIPTPTTVPSSSLKEIPNFGSLFRFDHRLKTLETDFLEFKKTNQFVAAVSSILGIVDTYLANKMHDAVKTVVQLQSDRLRDETQAKNADFINKLDDNIKKIIKDQVKEQVKEQVFKILPKIEKTVNEQLEAKVLTQSSNKSKTSHVVAANLSELEMKKILIDKMESNKSIHRSDEQKNLYKALVDAYESDKLIVDTYGDTVSFKRCRDDEDKDEEPSAGSNRGSKKRRAGKEPESTNAPKEKSSKTTGKSTEGSKFHPKSAGESAQAEEPMYTAKYLEEPIHQEFKTWVTEDQPDEMTSQLPDWFQKPAKPPTPDRDWNKTFPDAHGPVQPWQSSLAQVEDPRSCKSLVELEYFFEEVYKATTDQLDWNNPEGQQYPHDLRKPLPLIPNSRGRQVIPFDHFIKNDLAYLSGGVSSRKYTTSVMKTKAADYMHIKWIKDLVPNRMWSQVLVSYDKHALWGISHWGRKRQQFYGFAANRESARDVYSKRKIIVVTKLQIVEWHNYKHMDWITVGRDDDKLIKFKEGDFNKLLIQDIEDMLLFLVQGKELNTAKDLRLPEEDNDSMKIKTCEEICPVTTEEKAQKKNDVKSRSMLLMVLPNEHQLTFNQYKDAKTLFDDIQTRFDGNDATRKTQNTLLKQMYENFNAPSTDVWRNKSDLDTMSIDDLYNNFKIVEQEVKRTVTSSSNSNSSSQNMAFVSSPNSTNEVNIANVQVSTANSPVSTADTLDSTANLSDATVYAFLENQPNRSQLVHEDLEQIHEDDLEEMDLKWQLALLSIRERRGLTNQDNMNKNQDSSRRTVNVEETSSKSMVAIDGTQRIEFNKSEFNLATYKRGLASIEEQLVFYKKIEVMFCDQIAVLKIDTSFKDSKINALKSEIEKLKKEKESNQIKINKFENASKSLDKLIRSQISDNSRKGVGFVSYNVVLPPPTGLFAPPTIDLSNFGLEEFQQPEFEGYGPKASKTVCKYTSNEVEKTLDAPLGEKLVSEKEKQIVFPTKIEFAKQQEKPARKLVKANQVNVVKASACWVWRLTKLNSASITFKRQIYIDARGRSKSIMAKTLRNLIEDMLPLGEEPEEEELLVNELLKLLPDESQVLLKVPRKNNMYSVDMKNIVPKESLTYLVAKATLYESMLWHRRLGHVNFKSINKLVKDNIVRGLPAKRFENDQTCVACLKGKQHKASFDKKVKIIRCDNGTEFKNRVMNEFCEKKGIKREFSIARTPQQNGVAERRNKTLIEAARTMLADSKLPTTFWAEAVNTAFYVQNRVIIVKPHNKTPYELFRGRTPALSFMRPFGCHVTILNTLDHLGKFDGKSDDGFFVGYSLTSKAFRVYNIRTRKVEENLHIRFLENKPIVTGDGPKWLFDIDSLTKSMNYVPVVAGTNSNDFAGSEESNGAGHTSKETEFSQDYIVMPLWKDGSMFDSSSKNSSDDEPQPSSNAMKV